MDVVYIGNRMEALLPGQQTRPFTGVRLLDRNGAVVAMAGNEKGRVLEKEYPQGTQQIANHILGRIYGLVYRPYTGTGALLDPAAELGDGITVGDFYSVLAWVDVTFESLYVAEISAPSTDEIDDEYPYKPRLEQHRVDEEMVQEIVDNSLEDVRSDIGDINTNIGGINTEIGDIWDTIGGMSPGLEVQTLTVTASGLAPGGTVTVSAPGITAETDFIITPSSDSWPTAMAAGVYCSGQGEGTLTFSRVAADASDSTASTGPVSVSFNVLLIKTAAVQPEEAGT